MYVCSIGRISFLFTLMLARRKWGATWNHGSIATWHFNHVWCGRKSCRCYILYIPSRENCSSCVSAGQSYSRESKRNMQLSLLRCSLWYYVASLPTSAKLHTTSPDILPDCLAFLSFFWCQKTKRIQERPLRAVIAEINRRMRTDSCKERNYNPGQTSWNIKAITNL